MIKRKFLLIVSLKSHWFNELWYNMRMKNLSKFLTMLIICSLLLVGCGNNSQEAQALDTYREQVESLFDTLSDYDNVLQAIDPASEDAPSQMLETIDALQAKLKEAAALEAPEEFENAQEMCRQASFYMDAAAEQYHIAFDSEEFNHTAFENAQDYYLEAGGRIGYMITFLHGEIPEGMDVVYEEDTEASE